MTAKSLTTGSDAAIGDRVIELEELSPPAARALLKLRFSSQHQSRMHELKSGGEQGMLASSA